MFILSGVKHLFIYIVSESLRYIPQCGYREEYYSVLYMPLKLSADVTFTASFANYFTVQL